MAERERDIFDASLMLPTEERESFIEDACAGDAELLGRLRRLLAAHELEAGDTENMRQQFGLTDPDQIGPYRILGRIGEGGMGVVYLAEQKRPVRRRVALKIIKLGMDTRDVIARFDSERQALALMSHPNIARILDAGATERGRPYFVMEYVRGESIVAYADQRRLGIEARLRLFLEVCQAVHHAHQKGVVHRDLKPTNILVSEEDGRPYPKVIDFGIAKATSQRLTELTLFTQAGHVIGTPEYMSPEQADLSPGEVDPRADVYALGVVLYELLIGVRPFDFRSRTNLAYADIQRIIRTVDPHPPSVRLARGFEGDAESAAQRAATVPALVRRIRGDLDGITTTALAKNPDRRYATAAALAADVEHFLEGKAVAARAPGPWYRAGKFIRRHTTATIAAGAVLVTALAFTVAPSRGPVRTSVPESPRILILPFEVLGSADDDYLAAGISEEISVRLSGLSNLTVLGRQTALFASASDRNPEEVAEELDADFLLEGTVRIQRGTDGQSDQMRIRAALTQTETHTQVWTDAYDGVMDDVLGAQREVAERVAEAVGIQLPEAGQSFRRAQPTENTRAYEYFLRGNHYARQSELESDMRTALELYYEAGELDPDFAEAWAAVSVMRSRIGWRGYDRSEVNLNLAREAGERALRADPGNADGHYALGYYYYYGFRDYSAALDYFTSANERRPNDPDILYALGLVYRRLGQWDAALSALRRAFSLNPRYAQVAITLGETELASGDYVEAEEHFNRAIDITRDRPGIYLFKAWLYLAWKDGTEEAVQTLREGWDAVGGVRSLSLLGRYLSNADWWLSRSLGRDERYQRMFQSLSPMVIDSAAYYLHGAELHEALEERALSRAYYDSTRTVLEGRVAAIDSQGSGDLSPTARSDLANAMMWLAVAYAGLDMGDSAIVLARRGATLFTPEWDALHGGEGVLHLALVHAMTGDRESAIRLLAQVLSRPSAFRIGMLRHDPFFAGLLEDRRLARLLPEP